MATPKPTQNIVHYSFGVPYGVYKLYVVMKGRETYDIIDVLFYEFKDI